MHFRMCAKLSKKRKKQIMFLKQFIGEYVKSINLEQYNKAIYFLEIETEDGVITKKLILQ